MTIGVTGPVELKMLDCDFEDTTIPETHTFPLTVHFVNALIKLGHQVVVYTNSPSITEPVVLHSKQVTACVGCTKPQPGRRMFNYERKQLQALMQQHPADIIYTFWTYEYAWAALASGIPTVVSVHDIARKIFLKQPDSFRLVRYVMDFVVKRKAKWLVANSAYTYSQLSTSIRRKATVINNFYSTYMDNPTLAALPKENYIVSVVMGFTKRKGIPRALHAFARLRKKFPTLEYHLIGAEMEPGGAAQQYAKLHKLEEGVKFLGPLQHQELMQQVAKAKVLLHPSEEESFGMAVLESILAGTPVVGGKDSGFVPHLLQHGEGGVLCNILSEESMAEGVERLLNDTAYAKHIAVQAYEFAKANFSEEVVIAQHLNLFRTILNNSNTVHKASVKQKTASPLLNN